MTADCTEGDDLPRVSLLVFTFNHAAFAGDAVRAAMAQDYARLEIVVSDDASCDATLAEVERAMAGYARPHTVKIFANETNLGVGAHFACAVARCGGDFIVHADGDDISAPDRVRRLADAWSKMGRPSALIFSDFAPVDAASNTVKTFTEAQTRKAPDLEAMARGEIGVLGATMGFSRDLIDGFAPLDATVTHVDRVLPFRARLAGGDVVYVDRKLVRYRVSGGISRAQPRTAEDYLGCAGRTRNERLLADARQRLSDARGKRPSDGLLIAACEATVADHEAFADFASAQGGYEGKLVKWAARGARLGPLVSLYLKQRFHPLFAHYYRLRWPTTE